MKKIFLSAALCASLFAATVSFNEATPGVRIDVNKDNVILSYHNSIKNAKTSVVNISTTKEVQSAMGDFNQLFNDPYLKQFFNFSFPGGKQKRKVHSLGSGVIATKDGYIITNNHVIGGAQSITVSLPGSHREYKAKLVGADAKTDLAVIKIDAKNLQPITFANSKNLMEGDVVFAIGNPFGVGISVTSGIISALNKQNIGLNQYENFIQTDAAINPGNSGGALVDSRGDLVGINSAILSKAGASNGIGFAIPANMVQNIAMRLIKDGKIERGYMGVAISNLSNELKKAYSHKEGALITNVQPKSPAAKAGLRRGDLVIKVNNTDINSANELKNFIGSLNPTAKLKVTFERDAKIMSVELELKAGAVRVGKDKISGLSLEELNNNLRSRLNIPANINGLLVVGVRANSKALEAGFLRGDVIIAINQSDVSNLKELNAALAKAKGQKYTKAWIFRNGYTIALLLN